MKKTTMTLFLATAILMSGCFKTIVAKQSTLEMNAIDKNSVGNACKEINSQGDIFKLLKEIKNDTNEVIKILEDGDLPSKEARVTEIASKVDQKTKLVLTLSKAEWVSNQWTYEVKWNVDEEYFDDLLGAHIKNGFDLKKAVIQDVYFMGEKRADLIKKMKLVKDGNTFFVTYKNKASSLELCQLHKTLMVIVKVDYRNITNRNERFFNLMIDVL
jgi:hypothetical protein